MLNSTATNEDLVETFGAVIRDNRRLTVREAADEVGIGIGSCLQVCIKKYQMRHTNAKFVPRLSQLFGKPSDTRCAPSHPTLRT
jgi:hypothetical protein